MKSLKFPLIDVIENTDFELKAKSRKEMALDLGLSSSTFYRKLKELGYKNKPGLLSPKQQLEIRKKLGYNLLK